VEIGGWDSKNYITNAPLEYLPDLCEKHCLFTLAHALMSPRLTLRRADVQKQAANLYKITAVVANEGFLPTYTSKRAQDRKIVRPIEVRLDLPEGASIVSGEAEQEIGQLEGRSNKIYSGWFSSNNLTDNQKRLEWVVRAPEGSSAKVEVRSERAGIVRTVLKLE
jgi:hypothetical protein